MVVLASEQLWPNIHGLVHWHARLKHLCIYCTTDPDRSARPARRLAALCEALYPVVKVHLPTHPLGMLPDDVHAQVRLWKEQIAGQVWVINATGGNKLMFAGALRSVGDPHTSLVYRELADGRWYELCPGPAGPVAQARDEVALTATDHLPVKELVKAQWDSPDTRIDSVAPQSLPVLELTREALRTGWHWPKAFQQAGQPSRDRSGMLFEQYIAAVLLELGVSNQLANLIIRRSRDGEALQEIDLVANHGGRLAIIDCKLRSEDDEDRREEKITSQIRQAALTRRVLFGLGASLLLLRPNRLFSDDLRALARELGLTVVDARDARALFTHLARFFGVKQLPPSLGQAEKLVQDSMARGVTRAFCQEPREVRDLMACSPSRALADLDAYARRQRWGGLAFILWSKTYEHPAGVRVPAKHRLNLDNYRMAHGQDWIAYRLGGVIRVHCGNPSGLTPEAMERCAGEMLQGHARVCDFKTSRKTCSFRLEPYGADETVLVGLLEKYVGRTLLGPADASGPGAG
jgi:hypothetical protein